jgi:hypothetical protein
MTDKQTPPDWVLIEAAKRAQMVDEELWTLRCYYRDASDPSYSALCDMIERYEQPPEDRKLLCAREAYKQYSGVPIPTQAIGLCVAAIELYEEGFGK